MKIRSKITLWIAATALFSTIIFSLFIVFELIEQPFNLIDKELQHMAEALVKTSKTIRSETVTTNGSALPNNPDQYWIRISDQQGDVLYQSAIAKYTDIPPSGVKTKYNVERHIPREQIWLGQDSHDDVAFRVRVISTSIDHHPVRITIAKPIEDIEEEYIELMHEYAVSLLFCTLFIIVISYKLAGKILKPVASISSMAKKISDESLDKRIPLSGSKDEFYDLSCSLNRMFDRLQYSFERQKEFVSNASHELKSPITLLKIAQEELLINGDLSPAVRNNLERQVHTTHRISKLVRDLLDLSRLQQLEKIATIPVDLSRLMNQVLDDYEDLVRSQGVRVKSTISEDLTVLGDPEKLFRLLVNLIDNSLRYNLTHGGHVIIQGEKTPVEVSITISNTARQHIPEKDLDLIFEQFYRVEKSRSTVHGGTGLGLTIVKKIIDLHNGTITVSNEAGGFVKVSLILPLKSDLQL